MEFSKATLEDTAAGIRTLASAPSKETEDKIERYLDDRLQGVALSERVSFLYELMGRFGKSASGNRRSLDLRQEDAERLLSLMLGAGFSGSDHSPEDLPEKLAESLNTVFDSLNQIIGVIHHTLSGHEPELETIRHVIGSQIEHGTGEKSLKNYLDQIKKAFLTSHNAFQQAALSIVREMLHTLDPVVLANATRTGLKFGPLRKAEIYDSYEFKYRECRKWFDEGLFSEKLLREFEKICQRCFQAE